MIIIIMIIIIMVTITAIVLREAVNGHSNSNIYLFM